MAISPPRPRGPPLNALRAFEAAARHGSFAAAADELCVTPGAIAQHVKTLEAWAGAPLFARHAKGVAPTALGRHVLPGFVAAFDRLGEAVQRLRSGAAPGEVRIAALPAIAQLWLSPRLPAIRAAVAGTAISITAMETPPNLRREPFDLAIFFENLPGAQDAVELCKDRITPVCAPAMARRLRHPADLGGATCLHDAAWPEDWSRWTAAAGLEIDTGGPVFSLYSLAVEEARNGAGVLMGHMPLVRGHLAAGSLVAPFDLDVPLARRMAIDIRPAAAEAPALRRIVAALSGEPPGAP